MKLYHPVHVLTASLVVVSLALSSFVSSALASSTVSLTNDMAVQLTAPNITLTVAGGSNLVSYSVDVATLTLNLDAGSNVTVKSNTLYTLTNSWKPPAGIGPTTSRPPSSACRSFFATVSCAAWI